MTRITPLVAALVAALALAGTAIARPAAAPKLVGTVGPGFTIHLTLGGKAVKSVKAGRYTFAIHDEASIHNFVVEQESGGHVERDLTSVPFVGTKNVTLTLKRGRWKFYCKPHESVMFGFFTVR